MNRLKAVVRGKGISAGLCAVMVAGAMAALPRSASAQASEIKISQVIVQTVTAKPYAQVVARLQAAIRGARFMVIGNPNYQMMQRMVGRERRGSQAFYIFRPDLGIPIFDNDYNAALAIPLKILIYEREDHKTVIRYVKPSSDLDNYHGLQSLGQTLDKMIADVVSAAVK